jgi:hypothetical protein
VSPVPVLAQSNSVTVNLPQVDLTKVIPDLVEPFLAKLLEVIAEALTNLWNALINSGINLLTRTAPEWLYQNSAVAALAQDLVPALNGITALAVVVAGIGLIGRELWGLSWGPVEGAAKIAMGVVYGAGAIRLCTWSIDLVNSINAGLGGVDLAKPPGVLVTGSFVDAIVSALLAIAWIVVGLWLLLLMAERLGMLVVLFIIAPVALGVWGIPQARSFTVSWIRLWVGWLIAQPLMLICLKIAANMAGLFGGGSMSVLVGIAMLLLARNMATLFVTGGVADWGASLARTGLSMAMRRGSGGQSGSA